MIAIGNPGTWACEDATREHAAANVRAFVEDMALRRDVAIEPTDYEKDGRFGFTLTTGERSCEVWMPGLPIEQVRYLGEPGQSIWDFPRLYVNKSSWVWCYGLGIAASRLLGER